MKSFDKDPRLYATHFKKLGDSPYVFEIKSKMGEAVHEMLAAKLEEAQRERIRNVGRNAKKWWDKYAAHYKSYFFYEYNREGEK